MKRRTITSYRPEGNRLTYRTIVAGLFVATLMVIFPSPEVRGQALVIDHSCSDIDQIPPAWIEQAKADLRLSYGHTSHGSQPIDGMKVLLDDPQYQDLFSFNTNGSVESGVLSIDDRTPGGDIGWGNMEFDERTRTYLVGPGSDRNVVIWSWCGQVSDASEAYIDLYLSKMESLEADYPAISFVYMTGHLDGTGESGNLKARNDQIRTYCIANNKILYDFADIESYDPNGLFFRDLYADDACDYSDGNWAEEWCVANPGSPLCVECDICAHSQSLNCNIKARSFWWMMACLAGWEPDGLSTIGVGMDCQPSSATLPFTAVINSTLTNTLADEARVVAGTIAVTIAGGVHYPQWRTGMANLAGGQSLVTSWHQQIPALEALIGSNEFILTLEDVTPAPFNQPPYSPSGDTATASCTVTGLQ